MVRSSHYEIFYKKVDLIVKSHGNIQSETIFSVVNIQMCPATLSRMSALQVFSCEFWETFQCSSLTKQKETAASER